MDRTEITSSPRRVAQPLRGRDAEVARFEHVCSDLLAASGTGLVVVEGDAGIGKSRLLAEFSLLAARHELSWFDASCDPIAHDRPFGPLLESLECQRTSTDVRRRSIAESVARLGALGRVDQVGHLPSLDVGPRYGVQDDIVELILEQSEERPSFIVIDDAQWVDPATVSTLAAIVRRRRKRPVGIVLALRPGDRPVELESVFDRWADDLCWLTLEALTPDVVDLVAADLLGTAPGDELRQTLARAGGNSFSVVQLTRAFASGTDVGGQPSGVRLSVMARVNTVGPQAQRVLTAAAVLGVDFTPQDLCLLTGCDPFEVFDVLYGATRQGLLIERGSRFGFSHDLVSELVAAEMPTPLRMALHRRVVAFGGDLALSRTVLAHHVMASAMPGDLAAIETLCSAAADVAEHSPHTAMSYLDVAQRLCDSGDASGGATSSSTRLSVDIALQRAVVLCVLWRAGEAVDLLSEALKVAATVVDVARLRASRARCMHLLGDVGAAADEFERLALSGALGKADEAAAWADVTTYRLWAMQGLRPVEEARRALALAESTGVVAPAVQALGAQAVMAAFDGEIDQALEYGRLACARGAVLPYNVIIPAPAFSLGVAHMAGDELEAAMTLLAGDRTRIEQLGDPFLAVRPATALLVAQFLAGRWDEVEAESAAILSVCDDTGSGVGRLTALVLRSLVAHYRGDAELSVSLAETASMISSAGDGYAVPFLLHLQALHLEARGDAAGAAALMADTCGLVSALVPAIAPWFALDAVRLALGARTVAVEGLVDGLVERASAMGRPGPHGMALVAFGAARLDASAVREGLALVRSTDQVLNRALAHELGSVVLAAAGDSNAAKAALVDACSWYEQLGALDLARRSAPRGGRQGGAVESRPRFGWGSITPAETAVLRLVATGVRNAEIADRLVLSKRTVESHVSSMLLKLGLTSRVQLAVEANQHLVD